MQSCCYLIASACPPIASICPPIRRFSCWSPLASASNLLLLPGPIASASTAAPRLCPLPAAAPRLHLLQLLLQLLLPIASASAAAPRLRLLQLLLARLRPLRPLLPNWMHPLAAPAGFQPNVLEHSSRSSRFSK